MGVKIGSLTAVTDQISDSETMKVIQYCWYLKVVCQWKSRSKMSFLIKFIRGEKNIDNTRSHEATIVKLEKEKKEMDRRLKRLEAECNRKRKRNEDELIFITKRLKYMERKERIRETEEDKSDKQKEKMKMIKEEIRVALEEIEKKRMEKKIYATDHSRYYDTGN